MPEKQLARRQRALAALGAHTAEVLDQLRDAEDELLAGEVSAVLLLQPLLTVGRTQQNCCPPPSLPESMHQRVSVPNHTALAAAPAVRP